MPTFSKLMALTWFAALGWVAAQSYAAFLPAGSPLGYLREVATVIGALCGWKIVGRNTGQGQVPSIGNGLRAALCLALFTVLVFSGVEMIRRALRLRYEDVSEALFAMLEIMLAYGRDMLDISFLSLLIGGGILGGMVSEWIEARWRRA